MNVKPVAGLCWILVCGQVLSRSANDWPGDLRPMLSTTAPWYRFEGDVPVAFRPDADSHLTLNHRWYRGEGDTSLRWDWDRAGASFAILCPGAFPRDADLQRPATGTGVPRLLCAAVPVFSTWIYNETPRRAILTIEICAHTDTLRLFFVSLDFAGWRELRIPYGDALPAGADTLHILAPDSVRTGTLYFDELSPWRDVLTWQERPPRDTLWPTASSPEVGVHPRQ